MYHGERLNAVVGLNDDGEQETVRDRILRWLRSGIPYDTSVLRANVSLSTMQRWMKEAAKAEERAMTNPLHKVSPYQRDLILFSRQIESARAEGEARFHELMHRLAEGNLSMVTTTMKLVADPEAPGDHRRGVPPGYREIERTERHERTAPHYAAIKWVLENRYGRRMPTELVWRDTLAGALSDDEGYEALIEGAEAYLAQRSSGIESNGNGSG